MSAIQLTENAKLHIKANLAKNNHAKGFKIAIKKTGCSGFSYQPQIVNDIDPNDKLIMIDDEFALYFDPAWESYLQGMVIDFVEDKKLGISQKRLVFINANEQGRCGCGESFHIK
jgi:iron-sulfur cluster assembly protein